MTTKMYTSLSVAKKNDIKLSESASPQNCSKLLVWPVSWSLLEMSLVLTPHYLIVVHRMNPVQWISQLLLFGSWGSANSFIFPNLATISALPDNGHMDPHFAAFQDPLRWICYMTSVGCLSKTEAWCRCLSQEVATAIGVLLCSLLVSGLPQQASCNAWFHKSRVFHRSNRVG